MDNSGEFLFADEVEPKKVEEDNSKKTIPFKVMIIDDEDDVHKITHIALKNFIYQGRGLSFVNAYSASGAEILLKEHPDTALILLDVVMEEQDSGIKLVRYIRDILNNQHVRIILRTGYPGQVPEKIVILNYDINDYKEKGELTEDKLFSTIVSSLRSYEGITKLDTANKLLSNLLDSFIQSIASAIDDKSHYTAGHIRRVAQLTQNIAKKLCESKDERWADFNLTDEEQNEIRIAAWMHDIGKITTPEYIVDKATKLQTIVDRIELIFARGEILKRDIENEALRKKIEFLSVNNDEINKIDDEFKQRLETLEDDLQFLKNMNLGGEFMEDTKINRVKDIAAKTIKINGQDSAFLTYDEVYNLSIRRGTLTEQEREIIQNHVKLTIKMLIQLPWPDGLKMVPQFAGAHHETLSGTGYPNKLKAEDLPIQARIIAFADIFEALTAADRPYKKGKNLSDAFKILGFMIKDRHLDKDIIDFFVESGLVMEYARNELQKEQLDDFVYNGIKYTFE